MTARPPPPLATWSTLKGPPGPRPVLTPLSLCRVESVIGVLPPIAGTRQGIVFGLQELFGPPPNHRPQPLPPTAGSVPSTGQS